MYCFITVLRSSYFGYPHRSVLGPLLFVFYTADLLSVVESHGTLPHNVAYADDTQIHGACMSRNCCHRLHIKRIWVRCSSNFMNEIQSTSAATRPDRISTLSDNLATFGANTSCQLHRRWMIAHPSVRLGLLATWASTGWTKTDHFKSKTPAYNDVGRRSI